MPPSPPRKTTGLGRIMQLACRHHWIRARLRDGSYGLRCQFCMREYPHTWDELIRSGVSAQAHRDWVA